MARVKVKKTPSNKIKPLYQQNPRTFALDTGFNMDPHKDPEQDYRSTYPEADREDANVEAEAGETLLTPEQQHFHIGGKSHKQGGTPITVEEGAFIFSKMKALKVKGAVLEDFGINPDSKRSKKGIVPADIAKQYDTNPFIQRLEDPKSDKLDKKTSALVLQNMSSKLNKLKVLQEGMKGFPTGVPQQPEEADAPTMGYAAGGGYPIDEWKKSRTKKGRTSPTGKDTTYNRDRSYIDAWEAIIPGIAKLKNKEAQSKIYDHILQTKPEAISSMWEEYGLTNKGKGNKALMALSSNGKLPKEALTPDNLKKLKDAYVDGYFGARQLDPSLGLNEPPAVRRDRTPIDPLRPDARKPLDRMFDRTDNFKQPDESLKTYESPNYDTGYGFMDYAHMLASWTPLNKQNPIRIHVEPEEIKYNPLDLEAQRQSIKGQASTMARANNTLSGTASQASVRNSQLFSQSQDPINQSFGQQFNANQAGQLGVDQFNAQNRTGAKMANAQFDDQYNTRQAAVNENFDNEKRLRLRNFMQQWDNAESNRQVRNAANQINQDYIITANGQIVRKPESRDAERNFQRMQALGTSGQGQGFAGFEAAFADVLPYLGKDKLALIYAQEQLRKGRDTRYSDKNADGVTDEVQTRNPFLMISPFYNQ